MQTPTILRQRETTSARLPASTGFLEVTTALFKAKVTWPARPLPTYKLQLLQLKAFHGIPGEAAEPSAVPAIEHRLPFGTFGWLEATRCL